MVKVVWFRFQQCLVPITVLLVGGFAEARLFRDLFNHLFLVHNFGNTSAMKVMDF